MGLFGKKKTEEASEPKSTASEAPQKVAASATRVAVKTSAKAQSYGVIIAPVITEKSHGGIAAGKYTFRVSREANKKSIRKMVSEMYGVTVTGVNITRVPKKRRTIKYDRGYQSSYKKAIVTLKEGDRIADLELS